MYSEYNCYIETYWETARILLAEVFATFIFVLIRLQLIFGDYSKHQPRSHKKAIIIGATLSACICLAVPVSGGAINPALGFT